MGRLFGTDGVRGVANIDLTTELAMNIGKAAAMVIIGKDVQHPTVLIGRDTRISGNMIEGALIAGLCSVGVNIKLLGQIPTPAVAYLISKYNADAGIMISASHNPFEFNGIKIFNEDGFKLPDDLEEEIEAIIIDKVKAYDKPANNIVGTVSDISETALKDYVNFVISTTDNRFDGMKIALDCANGSASHTARLIYESLGATCHILSDKPDGKNINDNCGSTNIDNLRKYVIENNLDCGLAFDGDSDRCLAVDEKGNIVDGDFILAICAKDMLSRGKLKNNTVVGTIMSNMGFSKFCKNNNINFISTKVGDRYVLEKMLLDGYNIGGEQSGHIIYLDNITTGDGQLTGVQLLSVIARSNKKLSELASIMERYPQVLINVKVSHEGKTRFYIDKEIKTEIKRVAEILGDDGRIIVRTSGTEPLIRVMIEGKDTEFITSLAQQTADFIKNKLS